eukprot:944302-Pelagomonas_calceolata.AAC.1
MTDQQLDGGAALGYSSQLLSFSLDRLKKEPKLLAEEELRLQRALQTTATTHYDAFIKTASCLQTIDTELNSVCGHLDHLLQVSSLDGAKCSSLKRWAHQEAFVQNMHVQINIDVHASA